MGKPRPRPFSTMNASIATYLTTKEIASELVGKLVAIVTNDPTRSLGF